MAAPPLAPCGLSAVARSSSSCPACWLAVVAFPPRSVAVGAAFRRSCGTTRPSDSSRPFATLSFRSRWLPHAAGRSGGREVSPGKNAKLRADAVAYTCATRRKLGFAAVGRLTPWTARLISASLSLGSALHLRLPPDGPSRGRPCRFSDGFLPSGPKRTFTSSSAPMPGAPNRTRCVLRAGCVLLARAGFLPQPSRRESKRSEDP